MWDKLVIVAIFTGFAVLELVLGRFGKPSDHARSDAIVEGVSTIVILVVTTPFILFAAAFLTESLFPGSTDAWAFLPWWAMFAILLVADDMTQYWWHRLSHENAWLYPLHQPHHSAEYMSVRIVYRNNLFYYLFMPGLWFSAILVHLGFYPVYAVYLVIKLTVIYAAHSSWRWDEALYKIPALSGLMWIVERVISTPATHSAHHGMHAEDGVTNYKGNYGNLLFFWDVLYGTALITRRYPDKIGIENMTRASTGRQLLWPIVRD
jgi:sterol desaturase/sphingolipid hydroxylase (fatty acid hydroxylase superfamily)